MGACSSCLGLNRRRVSTDEDDASRLLFDDPHSNQYGTFGDQNQGVVQADPQEVQRENEALQKVVAQTSNHLVDIFAMVPQNVQRAPSVVFSGQDARLLHYQDVLAKVSSSKVPDAENGSTSNSPGHDDADWLSEGEDDEGSANLAVVKTAEVGPLLGGFADLERRLK